MGNNVTSCNANRTIVQTILLAVTAMMLAQLQQDSTNTDPRLNQSYLSDYYNGTILANWPADVSPEIVRARILVRGLLHIGTWPAVTPEKLRNCNAAIQFAFVFASLLILWDLSGRNLLAPLLAAAFVPWGFLSVGFRNSYPYDLPAMFFCAAGLWAIVRRKYFVLLLVTLIGTMNKETCVFLIPAYLIAEWPQTVNRRKLLVQVEILALAYAVAYETPRILLDARHPLWLTVSSRDLAMSRFHMNLQHLLFLRPGGAFQNFWWVAALHLPALMRFHSLPRPIRAVYFALPVFLIPMMAFGNIYELRLFNELIPLGAVATAFALVNDGDSLDFPQKGTKSAKIL